MDVYDYLENIAIDVSKLFAAPSYFDGDNVEVYVCNVCGHFQIQNLANEQYYDDYIMSVSHTKKIQDLQAAQLELLATFAQRREYFLEIGCGDGAFLLRAKDVFKDVIGVEPSKKFYELCKQKELCVINEYLTDSSYLPNKVDGFAARQVFEHLENPLEVLKIISKFMNLNGVGLIEVPNAEKMLRQKRYFDIFADHVNYFTASSLCHLAKQAGFAVIMLRESFNGDYLELYVRKGMYVTESFSEKREKDFNFIKEKIEKYQNVSIWGAGAKTQAIFTRYGSSLRVNNIFDTDQHKTGYYVINSKNPIELPSAEKINKNDLIIIFAVSYQDEIISMLKNQFNYKGDILCLEENPLIVND